MTVTVDEIRLPTDVERGARWGFAFSTGVLRAGSGVEQRVETWELALGRGDVSYGIQDKEGFTRLIDFFHARRGRSRPFLFRDWTDYQVDDEEIGTGDGDQRFFGLTVAYTSGSQTYTREVRYVDEADRALEVLVDGVAEAYTLLDDGVVKFTTAPTAGQSVTWSGDFLVPVRFDTDYLELDVETFDAAALPSIPIVEVRLDALHVPELVTIEASLTVTATLTVGVSTLSSDADTTALVGAFDVAPTAAQQAAMAQLVFDLKTAGVWAKLDLFYMLAAHEITQAWAVNWVDPGTFELTEENATFVALQGWRGFNALYQTVLTPSWKPGTHAAAATLSRPHVGVYVQSNGQFTAPITDLGQAPGIALQDGDPIWAINPRTTEDRLSGGVLVRRTDVINGISSLSIVDVPAGATVTDARDHTIVQASAASVTTQEWFRKGQADTVRSYTASGLNALHADRSLTFRVGGTSLDNPFVACIHTGARLTATQVADFRTALRAYFTAVGVSI